MSPWLIYLWGMLDSLNVMLAVICLVLTIFAIVFLIIFCAAATNDDTDMLGKLKVFAKPLFVGLILSWVIMIVVPSKTTVAAMYIIPSLVNNEKIQEISGDSLEAMRLLTKKWLKQLTEEK